DLGKMLGARYPERDRQAEFLANACADGAGNLLGHAEEVRAAADVCERLVDGNAFNERSVVAENGNGRITQPLIVLEMPADEDEVRAEFARPSSRHAALD